MSIEPAAQSHGRATAGTADSGAYRRHHGWQWPLGESSWQAAHRGPCRRRQSAARAGRDLHQLRRRIPDGVQLLVGELDPAAGRSQLHFRAVAPVRCVRSGKAAPQQCAGEDHRLARGAGSQPAPADRRSRDDDCDQYRPQAAGRLQLWWQGRDRRGGAAHCPAGRRAASSRPRTSPKRRSIGRSTPSGMPDPDIIIRTSGERRFSNFLLWQSAYAELVFVEENWPDFDEATFLTRARGLFRPRSALRRDRGAADGDVARPIVSTASRARSPPGPISGRVLHLGYRHRRRHRHRRSISAATSLLALVGAGLRRRLSRMGDRW